MPQGIWWLSCHRPSGSRRTHSGRHAVGRARHQAFVTTRPQFLGAVISDRIGGFADRGLAGSAVQAAANDRLPCSPQGTRSGLFNRIGALRARLQPAIIPALCGWPSAKFFLPGRGKAGWRVSILLFCSGSGMAAGRVGWPAILYDHFGFYTGRLCDRHRAQNFCSNLAVVGSLVFRQQPATHTSPRGSVPILPRIGEAAPGVVTEPPSSLAPRIQNRGPQRPPCPNGLRHAGRRHLFPQKSGISRRFRD